MALADAESITYARKGPRCNVCALIEGMDPDDAATLARWMADTSLFSTTIEARLRATGVTHVAAQTISRHRAARCWELRRAAG